MNILIVANFVSFPWENGNCRFSYLLKLFDYKKNRVELITTKFYHNTKNIRKLEDNIENVPYKITLIDEPGYKKNVSIQRFYSHYKLSKNIKKYLYNLEYVPDVVYCSVPSLDVAKEVVEYSKNKKIKVIIDIQDLWPESFKMVLDIPVISNIIFYPMKRKSEYIYKNADEIVAVSDTYLEKAISINPKVQDGLSVYLGTDLCEFDRYKEKNIVAKNDNEIWIVYVGTLGTSYDIKSIIDAIKIVRSHGLVNLKFKVLGDGPLEEEFKKYVAEKEIDCEFFGRIEYSKMVGILCASDIAVNPIVSKSVASIINKVGDYAAAGLPVINTQESKEYKKLVKEYDIGFNCRNGDIEDIAEKIEKLCKDKETRKIKGLNNRKLALDKFDRKNNYNSIIQLIENNNNIN